MDHASKPTDETAAKAAREERRADIQRRLDEAADIMAETLIDMWKAKTRAELDGRPWSTQAPKLEEPIRSPGLLTTEPKGPPRRVFRVLERFDRAEVRKLLAETWFPVSDLPCEPLEGRRYRVVLQFGSQLIGVAVFDEYGDAAVLRAIAIRKTYRRQGHARALAAHVVRRAYENGVGRVYCAAASPWFVEEIGFEFRERPALPKDAARLPGIIDALPTACIFELTPTQNGHRTPRRMHPRSATELLRMTPDPKTGRPARSPGAPAEQKRHERHEADDEKR